MTLSRGLSRLLVVGLDGATFRLLRPWLEAGNLPCLARLYRQGVSGVLRSVTPPLSPEAWSTFMTGTNPGRHGVMNFLSFAPDSYELQFSNGAQIRQKTLWRFLSDAGKRVGVVGIPMTYPPETVNGYLVSGIETPAERSKFTHPPELCEELREALGRYDIHGDFIDSSDPEEYLKRVLHMVDNQGEAACYLLRKYPADLSVIVIGASDRVQHAFWRFFDSDHPRYDPDAGPVLSNAIKQVYERIDDYLAKMIEAVPDPKNIFIVSDHGFTPCHTLVHLNRWLEREGYLACSSQLGVGFRMLRSTYTNACRFGPRWLKDWLKNALPGIRRHMASFLLLSRVRWPHTQAFAVNTQHGYIYLNRKDRFPSGVVSPGEEAAQLSRRLIHGLENLRDPATGQRVVERVVRTRELYSGPAVDALPDLLVLWKDGYIARSDTGDAIRTTPTSRPGDLFEPTGLSLNEWSAAHDENGILMAQGPDIRSGIIVEGARLLDLAPTLLHLLGEPVPSLMEGTVLESILSPDFMAANPIRFVESDGAAPQREHVLSQSESEELADRLRRLGYLD